MPDMNPGQFARVEQLFFEAKLLPPERRAAFLEEACGGDGTLKAEVEALLRHADAPDESLSLLPNPQLARASEVMRSLIGTRVGAYEFIDMLGQGGMGVVYLARDVRLGRSVAIKALPPWFTAHPSRLARFEREAKVLASMSHPNVATVFGLEESAGAKFLVMERLEGETLARRLASGPMDLPEALAVCRDVADAVEAAHAAGVVHRDLKPANVMICPDGRVKVLDFGLAREVRESALEEAAKESAGDESGRSGPLTHEGAVLGTPGYMSPEQVRGRPPDRRTDVFSFGCILYECLTGRVAFPGETGADCIAGILQRQPDWDLLPPRTPATVRRLLVRCTAKDPHARMRDMGDVRLELEEALAAREWAAPPAATLPPGTERRRAVRVAPWLVAAALAAAAALAYWRQPGPPPAAATALSRFALHFPNDASQSDLAHVRLDLSGDGRVIVVCASDGLEHHLWTRARSETDFTRLEDARDAWAPAFSPDGEWVAYFEGGALRKRRLTGGVSSKVADVPGSPGTCHWGRDGFITFAGGWRKGIARVPDKGGAVEFITSPDRQGEFAHLSPTLTPDGAAVLFAVWDGKSDTRIEALDLATRARHTVVENGSTPRIAETPLGTCLLWERSGTLYGARFDPKQCKIRGAEVAVADGVLNDRIAFHACYDVASDGTLTFVPGPAFVEESRLSWINPQDPEPAPDPFSDERMSFVDPHFSTDGKRLSVVVKGEVYRPYLFDAARGTFERVIVEGNCVSAAISPDGERLVYSTNRDGPYALWVRNLTDRTEKKVTERIGDHPSTLQWSSDGKYVTFAMTAPNRSDRDVWVLNVEDRSARPFCSRPADERAPRLSPNGNWLAYVADDSGAREVYIKSFPRGDLVRQVSTGGGDWPEWAPDGRRLYYRGKDGLFAAQVAPNWTGESRPRRIYRPRFGQSDVDLPDYTVAPDGRLLVVEPTERGPRVSHINYVLNWYELLRGK